MKQSKCEVYIRLHTVTRAISCKESKRIVLARSVENQRTNQTFLEIPSNLGLKN